MDPQLRALLDHSKFHQGAVREVAPLLPGDDDALAALLTETCTGADQLGFLLVITAALDAGRTLDAALLTTCAGLCIDATRLGCFAWKMTGDVSAALMAALARGRFGYPMHAGILLVILEWCAKHRGGVLPEGFAAEARRLARAKELKKDTVILLATIAARWGDAAFIAVLRQHHLANVWEKAMESGAAYAGSLVKIFDDPAMAFVPAAPPRTIAHQQPVRRAVEKISRNDPCPCGSGKKYKRCCFDKDRERLTFSSEVAGLTYAELRAEPDTGLTELRIKKMPPHELARLDPRKVPSSLRTVYLMQCTGLNLLERSAEIIEVMTFDDDEDFERAWDFVMFFVMRAQRKDIAERIVAARARHTFKNELPDRYRLILAHDDPAWELRLLDALARKLLTETDPEKLASHAYGIICSRHAALGILAAHGLIARTDRKQASFLLQAILETRDKLDLPPDDPLSDVLEKRLAEETSDEGADAARLREARQRLDVKAAEVRALKEEIDHQRRRLDRQERAQREREATPVASPAPSAADEATLREMRARLATLKATLGERGAERLTLRRELEKAHDELETLRREEGGAAGTASASASEGGAVDEAAFYLPEQPAGNQPLRLAEFPPRFRETLEALPRQAARGALAMIGRLAGGEPAAFVGVVQLKACHGILRQRVGSEHRLLFRLLPDRVQVVDFINRRDLDRKIKALRAAGG